MSRKKKVPVSTATTDVVEGKQAFDYWRSTIMGGVDVTPLDSALPFSAGRTVAASPYGAILHAFSDAYKLERTAQHVRRDGRDDVGVTVVLSGNGYIEQGNNGALLKAGDIAFHAWERPGGGGNLGRYEELRLTVPRSTFLAEMGDTRAYGGRRFGPTPLSGLFVTYLRAFAYSVADMSEAETGIAIEGALHLLRGAINGGAERADGEELSRDALRSLALARIERCLHDPEFGPDRLAADLRISRSRLYAAFAGGEGIAARIREARLDRAHDRIVMMRKTGIRVTSIMTSCGFTDPAAFSRAFRRRFGLSPRELLTQGDG
ncbi:helix-turn-helix domain-containing protein [Methylobacterium sp. J-026]|uniref:helix-turn-helix domain-containing protein n=1 Tax=Methylobacterium sp. J-026 TaxID=2836624 RepID=UPI001FBB5D68|nr:helix-turn-helix domain-containing protein [Methylobacterium sp. J-026]MCJ2136600.1 helix-turn-helix domain-containing protein [Methylobacterium sp. J-026]